MKTKLQDLRKSAGYRSAKAFAEANDIPVSTYTDHEQGRRSLTLDVAWRYADIFDVTLDELAGREYPKKEYADQRQGLLNRGFEVLDDAGKDMAVASVQGMAAAYSRGEDEKARPQSDKRSA